MGPDPLAEYQQGEIHIRHPRKIPGNGGILQGIRQLLRGQFPLVAAAADKPRHLVDVGPV